MLEPVWTIELFGGLRALPHRSGEAVTRFRTRKAAALLARLAFRRGDTLTRDELIETLWPYADPDAALARLAVELTSLRRQLEPAGIVRGTILRADRFTLSLDPAAVATDVALFEETLRRARLADPSERPNLLNDAVRRYSGPLLPQIEGDWIEPERERLSARFVAAAGEAVEAALKRKDYVPAVEIAQLAAQRERLREETHVLLMRSEIAAGQPQAALKSFEALTRMRHEMDGGQPTEEARQYQGQAQRLLQKQTQTPTRGEESPAVLPAADARTAGGNLPGARPALPLGTVAFLATDIEGSTGLGRKLGEDRFARLLEWHHALLRAEFARANGIEFNEAGDGFFVVFPAARDALRCAYACQQALTTEFMEEGEESLLVRVRMAIHVADIRHLDRQESGETGYRGMALHDIARLLPAAWGGQVFLSEAAEAVLRRNVPEGIRLADRGIYHLRDAPAPEHIFEAQWGDLTSDTSPAPRARQPRTPTLPPEFTRFFGRENEVQRIAAALSGRGVRLLTLTGMGGSGKTRLAIEAARALAHDFAGAVWFVPLLGTADPVRLPDALRAVVAPENAGDAWDALTTIFAATPCLLVLDNMEHLLGDSNNDATADFVQTLLERFPHLSCLATSRQRVGIAAEQEFAVRPLPTPKAVTSGASATTPAANAQTALSFASVALFEDRAKRARFDFQVTDRNAAAVTTLCARLEGIPLALELAAAWARLLTPAEMLTQFDDIRRSRDRNLPDRHRSLDAAIEGSYRLLDDEQQAIFRALSVFQGGWTLAAARAVCDDPMALALLADLRDRSLVVVDEHGDDSRYRFLETVRAFATARLDEDADQCEISARRHTAWYAALAAEANDALQGPDQAAWLTRLADEHQNLIATLDRADRATRLAMASELYRYWMVRGYLAEGRKYLTDALENDDSVPEAVAHKAINVAGVLAMSASDLTAARPLFTAYAEQCRAVGDERGAGIAIVNLAIAADMQGDLVEARNAYESTIELWRRLDRRKPLATVLSNLGNVLFEMEDFGQARTRLEESLTIQEEFDDLLLRANTLNSLAEVSLRQKDYAGAVWHASECVKLRLSLSDTSGLAKLFPILAALETEVGSGERAARLYGLANSALAHHGISQDTPFQHALETNLSQIRSVIGMEATQLAFAEGSALTQEESIALVLDILSLNDKSPRPETIKFSMA